MSIQHHFDIFVAEKYGVIEAILINNFQYWIIKNKANGKNYYDGHFWTWNTVKAYTELFPYLTHRQIEYSLKKLVDQKVLLSGNHNKKPFDRTKWYAFADETQWLSISQNCEIDPTNLKTGICRNVKPIPDIKPDIYTNKNSLTLSEIYEIVLKHCKFKETAKDPEALANHIIKNEPFQLQNILKNEKKRENLKKKNE